MADPVFLGFLYGGSETLVATIEATNGADALASMASIARDTVSADVEELAGSTGPVLGFAADPTRSWCLFVVRADVLDSFASGPTFAAVLEKNRTIRDDIRSLLRATKGSA